MSARLAIRLLVVGVALVSLGYASAFVTGTGTRTVGRFSLVLGLSLTCAGCLGFARPPSGRGRRVYGVAIAVSAVAIATGLGAPLLMADPGATVEGLWLGLPRRAAIAVYVAGALPLVLLPVAYAVAFGAVPAPRDRSRAD